MGQMLWKNLMAKRPDSKDIHEFVSIFYHMYKLPIKNLLVFIFNFIKMFVVVRLSDKARMASTPFPLSVYPLDRF